MSACPEDGLPCSECLGYCLAVYEAPTTRTPAESPDE